MAQVLGTLHPHGRLSGRSWLLFPDRSSAAIAAMWGVNQQTEDHLSFPLLFKLKQNQCSKEKRGPILSLLVDKNIFFFPKKLD